MSRRTPAEPPAEPSDAASDAATWFRLKAGSPLVAILTAVSLVAVAGLGAALVLSEDVAVAPYAPEQEEPRSGLGSLGALGGPFAFLVDGLAQRDPTPIPSDTGGGPDLSPAPPVGSSDEELVRLSGGLTVPVPARWSIEYRSDTLAVMQDGEGGWFSLQVREFERTNPAADLVASSFREVLPPEVFSHLETSGIVTLPPYGSLVSWAVAGYSAVRTDPQGAVGVGGNLFALVRDDGLALVMGIEVVPTGDWDERVGDWVELFNSAASAWGRAPLG